jgi:DNA repair exonuclease SbcCD ATPase subunit
MQHSEATAECDVDLSQLISVSVDFKTLQIFLRSVVGRVTKLEADEAERDKNVAECMSAIDELRNRAAKNAAPTKSTSPSAADSSDLDLLKDGLEALKARVNSLASGKQAEANGAAAASESHVQPQVPDSELLNRIAALEKELVETRRLSEERDAELDKKIGSLRAALATASRNTAGDSPAAASAAGHNPELEKDVALLQRDVQDLQRQLKDAQKELESQRGTIAKLEPLLNEREKPKSPTPAPIISSGIDNEALAAINEAIRLQGEMLKAQKEEIRSVGEECSRNASAMQEKAARQDVAALQERTEARQGELAAQCNDHAQRLEAIGKAIQAIEAKLKSVGKDRTDDAADLEKLRNLCAALDKAVQQLSIAVKSGQGSGAASNNSGIEAALIEDLRNQIGSLDNATRSDNEWMKGQIIEIRAVIEHIHHSKADASLVANKAEREYVENSMEKLMREVEQVLNATNAGLIDTLDKSLNILRDMIDGKATKADVTKLQSMMNEDQVGTVPEGLTGFKGYRCLGCNRSLEGMRQRPMGGNFSSFMNRLPNNQRPINSSQGVRVPVAPPPSAGYIGAPPGSA